MPSAVAVWSPTAAGAAMFTACPATAGAVTYSVWVTTVCGKASAGGYDGAGGMYCAGAASAAMVAAAPVVSGAGIWALSFCAGETAAGETATGSGTFGGATAGPAVCAAATRGGAAGASATVAPGTSTMSGQCPAKLRVRAVSARAPPCWDRSASIRASNPSVATGTPLTHSLATVSARARRPRRSWASRATATCGWSPRIFGIAAVRMPRGPCSTNTRTPSA